MSSLRIPGYALILGGVLLWSYPKAQCGIQAAFSYQVPCSGTTVSFTDLSTSDTTLVAWQWMFSGSYSLSSLQHPTNSFPGFGVYEVSLVVTDSRGCTDTLMQSLTLSPGLSPVFSVDTVCAGELVTFMDETPGAHSGIASWNWDFGDGNGIIGSAQVSHAYPVTFIPVSYPVVLTITDSIGCVWQGSGMVPVKPLPQPVIGHQLNCGSTIVQFDDIGTHASQPVSWNWSFGDNCSSSSSSPIHLYPSHGLYSVNLVVNADNGCTSDTSLTVNVAAPLAVDFSGFTVCQHDTVQMSAQILSGNAPVSSWHWNFGDGGTSGLQDPVHAFHTAGTMQVTLSVSDTLGCQVSISRQVEVLVPPQASFKVTNGFFGTPTQFVDETSPGSLPIIIRGLDFGDGSSPLSSAFDTAYHVYAAPGCYQASLFIADAFGCSSYYKKQPEVWSNFIKPAWVANTACTGQLTHFNDQSMVGSGNIVSWSWDFGDKTSSNLQNPAHSYDSAGAYTVKLVISTNIGVCDSAQAVVIVNPSPKPDFDFNASCEDDKKVFYNHTVLDSGNIVAWHWSLGQGVTSNAAQPERVYHESGTFPVTLVATTDRGCVDSVTHDLIVGAKPRVAFVANTYMGCERADIQFTDSSSVSDGHIVSWLWDFGDGSYSTGPQIVKHAYEDHGSYNVILTVISDLGCATTLMQPAMISVHPNPVAEFDFTPTDADVHRPTVFFMNKSTGADKFLWVFGDGHSTTVYEPAHNYIKPGHYQISLKAETRYGCINYRYREITVKSEPVLFLPDAFTPNGDGINDYFAPAGTAYTDEGAVTFSFQVFDRIGNLLFDSPGDLTPWDGRIRGGVNAPEGTYVCRLIQQDPDGKKHTKVGVITLMR
ncbi:MAG: PKD domain-containing protein [Bacteroidales bacterium]|nr:PKD domain-containing protein [Bacteroidales bacterium]